MRDLPWMQFWKGDWLKDPALTICAPATRGIWIDLLCAMHELDQCGELHGRPDQLARLARCSTAEIEIALAELKTTGAAGVTEADGVVTVENRRMKRDHKQRTGAALRQKRHRGLKPCHASVTGERTEDRGQRIDLMEEREPKAGQPLLDENLSARSFSESPSWEEFWAFCKSLQCGLTSESYAKDKFLAGPSNGWNRTPWRNFALRVKGWWEHDGRPETPNGQFRPGKTNQKPDHKKGF